MEVHRTIFIDTLPTDKIIFIYPLIVLNNNTYGDTKSGLKETMRHGSLIRQRGILIIDS